MTNEILILGLPYIIGLIAVIVSIVFAKYNIKINRTIIVGILTKIAELIMDKDIPLLKLDKNSNRIMTGISQLLLNTSLNVMNKLNNKLIKIVKLIGKVALNDKNKVTTGSTFMGGLLDLGKSIVINSATNYIDKKIDKM